MTRCSIEGCNEEGILFEEVLDWNIHLCKKHTLMGITNHAFEKEQFLADFKFIGKRWEGICIGCSNRIEKDKSFCEFCYSNPDKIILKWRGQKTLKQYHSWREHNRTNIYEV